MNPELDPHGIGRQLGEDGVASIVTKVEQYCAHEEQRIALENHAPIVALKAELSLLLDEERSLRERLRDAPPPTDLRHHRRKKIMAWAVAVILTVTGFFLAALTFAPFRLGWQAKLFCAGIATVVPFLIERLLEDRRLEIVVKVLTAIAAVAGLSSLMLLADIRGHLLEQEIQTPPAVVIDDARADQPPVNDFYSQTLDRLRLATILLSLAMELGAGLALRDAMAKPPHDPDGWKRLRQELGAVRRQMVSLAGEITRLEDAPAGFHARFWRDFYRSMLTQTVRSAMTRLLALGLAVALSVSYARGDAPQHLDLVIALDLTKSTDVKNPDGKSEFQKNVDGVTGVLAQIPAGSRITVIGITDHSFAQPYILLTAAVADDPGYFGERLGAGRSQLLRVWKQRCATLAPRFSATDILGALELTSQLFNQHPIGSERRVLVIFSDMRNHTRELDLETQRGLRVALRTPHNPTVDLRTVHVFALGVDGPPHSAADWHAIKDFWVKYFRPSGAALDQFTPLRDTTTIYLLVSSKAIGNSATCHSRTLSPDGVPVA